MSSVDDYTPFELIDTGHNSNNSSIFTTEDFNGSLLFDEELEDEDCCNVGYESIVVPVIFCLVVVSGCVGNLLVLIVVVRNREQYASTTNLFILNLAVADLFFIVFCVPFHAVIYTTNGWPFGNVMCKIVHFVQFASMTSSVYTLVAMSLDRFLAVGYPLRTKHLRTPPAALAVAVVVWLTSLLLASPWAVVFTVRVYTFEFGDTAICADDWNGLPVRRPTAFLLLFIVTYGVPVASIAVLSMLTVCRLWATETTNDGPGRRRSVVAKRRVTRLIAVVVAVFALCWLPSHVVWLWTNYFPHTWSHTYPFVYTKITAHVLSYANSCMNPIIYAFLSSRFRREFRRALRCRRVAGGRRTAWSMVAMTGGIAAAAAAGVSSSCAGGASRLTTACSRRNRSDSGQVRFRFQANGGRFMSMTSVTALTGVDPPVGARQARHGMDEFDDVDDDDAVICCMDDKDSSIADNRTFPVRNVIFANRNQQVN